MMLGSQQAQPLLASFFFGSFDGSTICNTCSSIYVTFRKISRERRKKKRGRERVTSVEVGATVGFVLIDGFLRCTRL